MNILRKARVSDVDAIMRIASLVDISTKQPEDAKRDGFLVSGFCREDYLKFLPHLLLSETDGQIAGYSLAMRREFVSDSIPGAEAVFEAAGEADFLLIKVIAVHPEWAGRGVAGKLYRYLLDQLPCSAFAAIVVGPVANERSIGFHEKFNFSKFSSYIPADGMARELWKRSAIPVVRCATLNDVTDIVRIADEHSQGAKPLEQLKKDGFLMSGYPEDFYRAWIGNIVVVAIANQIQGFVLFFTSQNIPSEVEDVNEAQEAAGEVEYLLIKQVGVSPTHQGTGLGKMLYRAILAGSKCPVIAQVILDPCNERSIQFHEGMGFKFVLRFRGGKRGVWRHPAGDLTGTHSSLGDV